MDPARDPATDARSPVARALARLRGWLRPPRKLRATRAGWCFFLLVFGVGFAALNTGNNLLYLVLALMLAFLVLSGVLSEAALRGIRVRRRLPREVFAECDARVVIEISNDQRRVAALAIVVEDRVTGGETGERPAGRCFALRIPPGGREIRSYPLHAERRGTLELRGFAVITRFPFGLFSKSLWIEDEESVLVYPALERVPIPDPCGSEERDGSRSREVAGESALAAGLRGYTPGDPRRRIHWRASLRAGSLLVRNLESERDTDIEVRLRTENERTGPAFEARVRRAASEVVTLLDAGRRVALCAGEQRFAAESGAGHRAVLLGFLAKVQPGPGAPG